MKKGALLYVFIILCLFLFLFYRKAYTQQGITQAELSRILNQSYQFTYPSYPFLSASYPQIQFSPFQFSTMDFSTTSNTSNYSFLFGNNWNMWQTYGFNNLFYPFLFSKRDSGSSKTVISDQETTLDSTIKFSATADKSTYDKAEFIEITLKFENNGSEEAIIEFTSEQKFDIIVKEKSGEVIRRLFSDTQGAQPSTTLTLQPDGTETFYLQWDQEDDDGMIVPSGTYTIDISLSAVDPEFQETVSITTSIKDLPRFPDCKKLKERLKKFWDELNPPSTLSDSGKGGSGASKVTKSYYAGGLYGGLYGYAMAAPFGGYGYAGFSNLISGGLGGYIGGGGYALGSYGTSLYGGYAGFGGYALSSYGATGLYGSFAGTGGYAFSSYSSGLYGGSAAYGLTGYGTSYGNYSGISGYFRLKTTPDEQVRDRENGNPGYSMTNVQVVGVDEADIIKNDGTYIYMIKGKTIQIVQGSPADAMQIVNVISPGDNIYELKGLYVQGNTLVLIGEMSVPDDYYYSTSLYGTRIYIYDITDRTNEILARKLIFWGGYVQSRKAGDTLYVIMNEPAPLKRFDATLNDLRVLLPHFYDSSFNGDDGDNDEIICDCDEVAYLPDHLSPSYLVVVGIPLNDNTKAIGREVILGKSDNVYATMENLYVTSEFDDNRPTDIYKFWLDDETISYGSNAQVSGKIINRFSMDEYEDHLRIATTSGSGSQAENNIFIFNSGMKETGSMEDFTSGGAIKSIRFIEDRCYAVISREILPLSVISLKDPTNPATLEVLDILGGTYYLHPIDENLLLGFGKEMVGSTEMGMKVSLYDLTDISDPQKISDDEIGTRYTKSEVLSDQGALLLSMEKNLMAFPVTVSEENGSPQYIFQGAYIYYIDDNGFEKIEGGVSHYPEGYFPIPTALYKDTSPSHINRIIYMGDYYYAVSSRRITARDISTHTDTFSLNLE